ncbi:hypothetical protein ACP0GC_25215 [Escherichia coli]
MSIIQGHVVGVTHYLLDGIAMSWAFLVVETVLQLKQWLLRPARRST